MNTYIVYEDHMGRWNHAALESDVLAFEEEHKNDRYGKYYAWCETCGEIDEEAGKLTLDHEPTKEEIDDFVRKNKI